MSAEKIYSVPETVANQALLSRSEYEAMYRR
jgi:hypothetical protein